MSIAEKIVSKLSSTFARRGRPANLEVARAAQSIEKKYPNAKIAFNGWRIQQVVSCSESTGIRYAKMAREEPQNLADLVGEKKTALQVIIRQVITLQGANCTRAKILRIEDAAKKMVPTLEKRGINRSVSTVQKWIAAILPGKFQ